MILNAYTALSLQWFCYTPGMTKRLEPLKFAALGRYVHCQVFFTSNPAGGWKSRAAMKVARGDKAVAVLNDKLHVVGGETKNSDGHSTPLMDVEVGCVKKENERS